MKVQSLGSLQCRPGYPSPVWGHHPWFSQAPAVPLGLPGSPSAGGCSLRDTLGCCHGRRGVCLTAHSRELLFTAALPGGGPVHVYLSRFASLASCPPVTGIRPLLLLPAADPLLHLALVSRTSTFPRASCRLLFLRKPSAPTQGSVLHKVPSGPGTSRDRV